MKYLAQWPAPEARRASAPPSLIVNPGLGPEVHMLEPLRQGMDPPGPAFGRPEGKPEGGGWRKAIRIYMFFSCSHF